MEIKVLKNGLRVIYQKTDDATVAVNVTVHVGSNNEPDGMKGIAHFIEHMLFEGTKKRPTSLAIASEIENVGGEMNAFTTNERTAYYIKIPRQYFQKALDVLADMIIDSAFKEKFIAKEKGVVINEIGSLYDDPRLYQWVYFEKALYSKAPMRHPIIGYKEDIQSLTREKVINFYQKYYVPQNMVVSIAGNVPDPFILVDALFVRAKMQKVESMKRPDLSEPINNKEVTKAENKKLNQAYIIIGFKTISMKKKESMALEVIRSILGRGFSGTLFEEIRNKRGLAYDLGVHNESKIDYGYFAINTSVKKKSVPLVKKIIHDEIKKIDAVSEKELGNAKEYLKGEFVMHHEENAKLADFLGLLELVHSAKDFDTYLKTIEKVTRNEVIAVRKKFLRNSCTVMLR